jgi:hypothetical protein
MGTQETLEKTVSPKKARKKKGLTYLLVAVVCLVISYIMYAAGAEGGVIGAFLAMATLICFVAGVIYLIGGFVGRE